MWERLQQPGCYSGGEEIFLGRTHEHCSLLERLPVLVGALLAGDRDYGVEPPGMVEPVSQVEKEI
jgi:hypothetical protein